MVPDKGEDFKSFRMRLREVGDMCDLSNLTEEQCYILKYQTTVNDEGLKQQMIVMATKDFEPSTPWWMRNSQHRRVPEWWNKGAV